MATRKKPSTAKDFKEQLLRDRERIRKEIEKEGAYRGGSSARKDLFLRPSEKTGPIKAYILPDYQERGVDGLRLPFIQYASHWVQGQTDDPTKQTWYGITCLRELCASEPYVVKRLIAGNIGPFANKKYEIGMVPEKVGLRCVPCDVLDACGDALPRDPWGKNPILAPKQMTAFQAISEEGTLKILTITPPAMRTLMNLVFDEDLLPVGQFEEQGVMAKIEKLDKAYGVTLLPQIPCPLTDWRGKLLDLETMTPNFMPFEEQVQHMYTNLPGNFAGELAHLFNEVEPPQVTRPPSAARPKPSRVRNAQ